MTDVTDSPPRRALRAGKPGILVVVGILAVLVLVAWVASGPGAGGRVVVKATDPVSGESGSEGSAGASGASSEGASRLAADGRAKVAPLDPRPALVGRVVDGEGRPVEGAVVGSRALRGVGVLVEPALTVAPQAGAATTDATGAFRFVPEPTAGIPDTPGGRHRVFAWAGARGVAVVEDVALDVPVEIVLAPGGALYGTVRDADGNPVEGAKLTGTAVAASGAFRCELVSGPGGAYVVEGIPAPNPLASATLHWEVEGAGHRAFRGPSPYPSPGERVPFHVVVHRSTLPRAPLVGIVVDGDTEAPVAGAHMRMTAADRMTDSSEEARTDSGEDGRFRFEDAPVPGVNAGTSLLVEADGYAPRTQVLGEGKVFEPADARIVLWRPAAIEGVIVDETGTPLPGVRISWWTARGKSVLGHGAGLSATDGTFRLEGIPAPKGEGTEATISATGRSDTVRRTTVRVRGGERTSGVSLIWSRSNLLPVSFVVGNVTDVAGKGIAGATVGFGSGFPDVVATDADGSYRLPRYKMPYDVPRFVYASAPGFVHGAISFDAKAPSAPHRIVLSAGRALAGVVVDEDGLPLAGVSVRAIGVPPEADPASGDEAGAYFNDGEVNDPEDGPGVVEVATTDGAGRFRWSRVPTGPFPVDILWSRVIGSPLERRELSGEGPVRIVVPRRPRPRAIELRVVDEKTGRPVPEVPWARWLASGADVEPYSGEIAGPGLIRTPMPRRQPFRFEVGAKGWCSGVVTVSSDDSSPHPRMEVRLTRGAGLRGQLRTSQGVMLSSIRATHLETGQRVEAPVDGQGRFELSGLPPGTVSLDTGGAHTFAVEPPTAVLALEGSWTDFQGSAVEGTRVYVQTSCERLVGPVGPDGHRSLSDPRADEAWVAVLDAAGRRIRRHVGRGLLFGSSVSWTLSPGEYTLDGQAPGGERVTLPFAVATGRGDARPPFRLPFHLP